jgi:hypothetical protein
MSIIAKSNKTDFTPAPEGLHAAVCVDVIDLGMVKSQWGESHQVKLVWQLEDDDPKTKRPVQVRRQFRNSLHEKSSLRPLLESWRGKKLTEEELQGFDLEKLLNVNCQIQVIHHIKAEGSVYANVQAIVPPGKGQTKLKPRDYVREKDRVKDNGSLDDSTEEIDDSAVLF